MNQNRTDKQGVPNRSSNMEQAEGTRENVNSGERMSGDESMRNESSSDMGTSSDRAMFSDRDSAEGRGLGSSDERNLGGDSGSSSGSSDSGGITNRELSREQREQDQLPERGRSKSESER